MEDQELQIEYFNSLIGDRDLMDEIRQLYAEGKLDLPDGILEDNPYLFDTLEEHLEGITSGRVSLDPSNPFEAIIQRYGRPALLIQDDQFTDPTLEVWKSTLGKKREVLNAAIKSVASVTLYKHSDSFPKHLGTGWMVRKDMLITNRHVAEHFLERANDEIILRSIYPGQPYKVNFDFKKEHERTETNIVPFKKAIFIEDKSKELPDMALIQVEEVPNLPPPLNLAEVPPIPLEEIAVIGYPVKDLRNDKDLIHKIFGGIFQVKRFSPGKVIAYRDDQHYFTHDATTLGGNSGSAVIRVSTGEVLGLHYAGTFLKENKAVKVQSITRVLEKLEQSSLIPISNSDPVSPSLLTPEIASLSDRMGYLPDYLGTEVPIPTFRETLKKQVAHLKHSNEYELKYAHFSLFLHKERQMACLAVCNYHKDEFQLSAPANPSWLEDPRIGNDVLYEDDLFQKPGLNRWQLAKPLSMAGNGTSTRSSNGQADAFFLPNCLPHQIAGIPLLWTNLEEHLLNTHLVWGYKISVLNGPVFKDTDKDSYAYRIPRNFFKVIIFRHLMTGKLRATGFLLTQGREIDNPGNVNGEYHVFQVPLEQISLQTNIELEGLYEYDAFSDQVGLKFLKLKSHTDIIT